MISPFQGYNYANLSNKKKKKEKIEKDMHTRRWYM